MSAVSRQGTCAACGGPLKDRDVDLEVLIDDAVRHVAVHRGHSTAVRTLDRNRRRRARAAFLAPAGEGGAAAA